MSLFAAQELSSFAQISAMKESSVPRHCAKLYTICNKPETNVPRSVATQTTMEIHGVQERKSAKHGLISIALLIYWSVFWNVIQLELGKECR
jgi:hypothetical protein